MLYNEDTLLKMISYLNITGYEESMVPSRDDDLIRNTFNRVGEESLLRYSIIDRRLILSTWNESYHNGDIYGYEFKSWTFPIQLATDVFGY